MARIKLLPVLIAVLAMLVLIAACAPTVAPAQPPAAASSSSAASSSAAAASSSAAPASAFAFPTEPITLEIWWHEYAPMTTYVKDLIEQYKKVRPNVTINATTAGSTDMNTKLNAALAAGNGPDIIDADASYYIAYYNKGVLEPINLDVFGVKDYKELLAKYTNGGLDASTFDGKVYTLPYQGNSFSLLLNNKIFQSAGLDPKKDAPKTWQDLITVCGKLKKVEGNRTVQKGFAFPYFSPRWELENLQPMTEQFGAKMLAADGKVTVNSPEAVKALTLWRDVTKACDDPKNTKNTPSNTMQDFLDGWEAMWITGPWATTQITPSPIKNDFTFAPLPQVDPSKPHTMVYGWAWGVYNKRPANNKLVAWDFIKFMLQKPDEWLAKAGFVQPVKGVEQTKTAQEFPFFDVHMGDVGRGTWYIRSEYVNEIAQAVGTAVDSVVYDNADPKTALDTAQAAIDKAMKK